MVKLWPTKFTARITDELGPIVKLADATHAYTVALHNAGKRYVKIHIDDAGQYWILTILVEDALEVEIRESKDVKA